MINAFGSKGRGGGGDFSRTHFLETPVAVT